MKELERENAELKKMLADSLLKNRVLEAAADERAHPVGRTAARTLAEVSALRLPPHCGEAARGRLQGRPQAGTKTAAGRRSTGAAAPALHPTPR